MSSHCLPNGFLGTGELPVPNISGATLTVFNPPSGLRRGVIVWAHGLYGGVQQYPTPPSSTAGGIVGDSYGAFGSNMTGTLCTNLAYDGWVVLCPSFQEDNYGNVPSTGIYNDVSNDSTNGARYLASTLHTWDHVYRYIQNTYGNWPIVVGGSSLGGWRALQIAVNRSTQINGYIADIPLTMWENLPTVFTPPYYFGSINASGADISTTFLNGVTVPGLVSYGTVDNAVWYGGSSSVASINGAGTGVAAASVTAITVSGGSTNFLSGTGYVTLTGLTGGTGRASYTYTGYSAGSVTGMVPIGSPTGTVTTSCAAVQSATDQMLTNAAGAGRPVSRCSTGQAHSVSITDSGAYFTGTTGTSISTINGAGTLGITALQASCQGVTAQQLISTKCAIQDSTGKWFVVTTTGVSSPNLTGVSIATTAIGGGGSGSSTFNNGAPICNIGTAITGGYSNISIPYWVNQTLDPSYPKTY